MQQGWLSNWLVKHDVVHRSLGFDHRGVETLQIKAGDWDSIAVILYVYGYNYLRSQCAYDVAPGKCEIFIQRGRDQDNAAGLVI